MRITLLNQYYAPDEAATAQILSDLGEALAARGHEVRAICCDRSYADPQRVYPKREVIDAVRVVRVRSTGFGRSSKVGRLIDYATYYGGTKLRLLFGRKPDVVIALTTPPMISLLASVIGHLRGYRTIFWSMDVYPDIAYELGAIRRGSVAGRLLAFFSRKTLQDADCTIALGETMAEHLIAGGARRVEVVHNWAEESVESGVRSSEFEASPDSELVVMYSGNMGLAHEFETLLAAGERLSDVTAADRVNRTAARPDPSLDARDDVSPLDAVPSRDDVSRQAHGPRLPSPGAAAPSSPSGAGSGDGTPSIRFLFVGGGPRRGEVERAVRERGLTGFAFSGYVPREQLAASLTAPDVHLVTLRERMPGLLVPSKIYGILAAGKPVLYVGPASGEIYDMIREGQCGVHVPLGDVDALVAAIRRYASDAALVARHGRNARTLYDARFTRAKSIGRFVEIVEGMAH